MNIDELDWRYTETQLSYIRNAVQAARHGELFNRPRYDDSRLLNLLLVSVGARAGARITTHHRPFESLSNDSLYQLIRSLNIPAQIRLDGLRISPESPYSINEFDDVVHSSAGQTEYRDHAFTTKFYLAESDEWLSLFQPLPRSHDAVEMGRFLDYPAESIVSFQVSNHAPNKQFEYFLKSLWQTSESPPSPQELKYMFLTEYVPAPTRSELYKSIEKGRSHYQVFKKYDQLLDMPDTVQHLANRVMSVGLSSIDYPPVEQSYPSVKFSPGTVGKLQESYSTKPTYFLTYPSPQRCQGEIIYCVALFDDDLLYLGNVFVSQSSLQSSAAEITETPEELFPENQESMSDHIL